MCKIKICGLKSPEDIEAVNMAMPDYAGFVFAGNRRRITFERAEELRAMLHKDIESVGVFVNEDVERIKAVCDGGIIDLVQLHGDEDGEYLKKLKREITCPVIKAVRIKDKNEFAGIAELECDYLLLDSFDKHVYGGSGKSFDWDMIPRLTKPFFLAGGLRAENLHRARAKKPHCLDVSSGAETGGKKDREKILRLVNIVRSV